MAKSTFLIEIITPEKIKFKGEAESATIPTQEGIICVLAHHAPLVGLVVPGELILKTEVKIMHFAVGEGFLQIRENKAVLLVDFAEKSEEINYEEALKQKEKIEQELSKSTEKKEFNSENLRTKLMQEIIKLKVAKKL